MFKIISAFIIFASFSAFAASTRIVVDVDGVAREGLVYFDYSMNSHSGNDYIHLEKIRVRVGRSGYNVSSVTDIDDHICQLLGYSSADYRIVGLGGYEDADSHIMRVNNRNVIVAKKAGSYSSRDFSLDFMTCVRPSSLR
ncbi:MAG TPA: hypothetical protein VKY27_00920 [Bacteriovoracaceae bacterium]|nr:hypothetical protein [Bacteriovoracaceae bacterium]